MTERTSKHPHRQHAPAADDTEHPHRTVRRTEEKERRSRRTGWITVGALSAFLLVLVVIVLMQNSAAAAKAKQIEEASTTLVAELKKLDLDKAEDAQKALRRLKETAEQEFTGNATLALKDLGDKATSTLHRAESRKTVEAAIAEVDAALGSNGPTLDAEQLAAMQKKLAALEGKAREVGPEFAKQWADSCERLQQGSASVLASRARAELAAGNGIAAVALFDKAQDALVQLSEHAKKDKDTATADACAKQTLELCKEEDAAALATFTPEAIAKVAARALLDPAMTPQWKEPRQTGFHFTIADGALSLQQDAATKGGMISFIEKEPWRNFQLGFDVDVTKGSAIFLFRVRDHADRKECPSFTVGAGQDLVTVPGTPLHVEVDLLGNTMMVRSGPEPVERKTDVRGKSRRGVLSILVAPDSQLTIRNLTVRDLR